jgi:hypothetical protein
MKNLCQDSWSRDRDLNQIPSKYEAGVLTTRVMFSFCLLYHRDEKHGLSYYEHTLSVLT